MKRGQSNLAPRVLVVDDDDRLARLLVRYLRDRGFHADSAPDAKRMDTYLSRNRVEAIVLDIMLSGEDGLSICRRLRAMPNPPAILMLSAMGADLDRIQGLEIGADDYMSKPFSAREVVARINTIIRRHSSLDIPGAPSSLGEVVRFGPFEFDLATRSLLKDKETVPLTTGEFAVLKVLVQNARQTLSRDKLWELARGREYGAFDRSLDVQIWRLRKLIEPDPDHPRYIQTIWGVGYVFVPD